MAAIVIFVFALVGGCAACWLVPALGFAALSLIKCQGLRSRPPRKATLAQKHRPNSTRAAMGVGAVVGSGLWWGTGVEVDAGPINPMHGMRV